MDFMWRTKYLILFTVFIDVIGFGIVIPILPFYVAGFNSSPAVITALFAVYSLCSFFSAPIIGALSDRFGRRPMLMISIASTAVGWLIFASATSLLFLFVGRIIDGLAAGNYSIAQGYLTDIAKDEKERTTNLGLIGMIFGIGFIIGPFIGGLLGVISNVFPFLFVGVLASINTVLAYFFLPETHFHRTLSRRISINPFKPIMRAVHNRQLRPNFIAWFFFGLALSGFQAVFALYLHDVFGFEELGAGIIYMVMGVVIALNQGVALKHIWLKYFREPDLELWMLLGFVLSFVLMSMHTFFIFMTGFFLTTFGQSVLRVVMTSQIAARTDRAVKGEVLGITSSLTSLSMAISPLVSGMLYKTYNGLPFLMSAVYISIAFGVLYFFRKTLPRDLPDITMRSSI